MGLNWLKCWAGMTIMHDGLSVWFQADEFVCSVFLVKNARAYEFIANGECVKEYRVETARELFTALTIDGLTLHGPARLIPGGFVINVKELP